LSEAKPIMTSATCDGFRKGSTHPTSFAPRKRFAFVAGNDEAGDIGAVTANGRTAFFISLAFFGALIFLGPLFLAWLWMLFSGWQEGLADRELR
jgi:hypothetical protein